MHVVQRESLIRRLGLGAVLAVVACCSLSASISNVLERRHPAEALAIWPWNGIASAHLAATQLQSGGRGGSRTARVLARKSLAAEPTAVQAVTVIGSQAEISGLEQRATQAFQFASRLSNRSFQTHLWIIEKAVRANRPVLALKHYDLALRTSQEATSLLLPTLGNIVTQPSLYDPAFEILANAPWRKAFLIQVAQRATPAQDTVQFFSRARRARVLVEGDVSDALTRSLFDEGQVAEAWGYYQSLRPSVSPRSSRDPRFTDALTATTPFDWGIPENARPYARFARGDGGSLHLVVDLPSGTDTTLLQQAQVLPPGAYTLAWSGSPQASGALTSGQLWWELRCADGRTLLDTKTRESGRTETSFTVNQECTVQILLLRGTQPDGDQSLSAEIFESEITPLKD